MQLECSAGDWIGSPQRRATSLLDKTSPWDGARSSVRLHAALIPQAEVIV